MKCVKLFYYYSYFYFSSLRSLWFLYAQDNLKVHYLVLWSYQAS